MSATPEPPLVARRFAAWVEQSGLSAADLASALGCHVSYIRHLATGEKLPGRLISHAIEKLTADWSEGPIVAREWDEAEIERARGGDSRRRIPRVLVEGEDAATDATGTDG